MPLRPVDPFADLPNPGQARRVHDMVAKMAPEAARVFTRMLVHEGLDFDTTVNGLELCAERQALVATMQADLAASAVSKAAGGAPIAEQEARWDRLQLIAKALGLTHEELSRNARLRTRDIRNGQFMRENRSLDYDDRLPITPARATDLGIADPTAAAQAAGTTAGGLSPSQLDAYRQAYLQVADLAHAYRGDPRAFLELRYEGDDDWDSAIAPVPGKREALPVDPNRTLAEARVHQLPRIQPSAMLAEVGQTNYFNDADKGPKRLGSRVGDFTGEFLPKDDDDLRTGAPALRRVGAGSDLLWDLTNKGAGLPPHARTAVLAGRYAGQFGPDAAKVIGPPADRAAYRYRGTERPTIDPGLVTALRNTTVPPIPPPSPHPREVFDAQMATIASRHERTTKDVQGRIGQPVVKPQLVAVPEYADTTGELTVVERKRRNDQNKQRENAQLANRTQMEAARRGGLSRPAAHRALRQAAKDRKASEAEARQQLLTDLATHARAVDQSRKDVRSGRRHRAVHGKTDQEKPADLKLWEPGPVLSYFRQLLPSQELASLQLKSGVTPPSQGVIFTADGKAIHQSVGYGDDWYLPFNLKSLDRLRGGEYIRTRAYGGLTPEDIYTGLTTGARAVTVVSHNGTFTMEFNDTFEGGRRYNDKAARMVNRYAQLLDTVRAGDVTLGIPSDPDLEQQLRDEVELSTPFAEDPTAFTVALRQKRKDLLRNPQLSPHKQLEVATQLLAEKADEMGFNRAGDMQGVTHTDAATELAANQALRSMAERQHHALEVQFATEMEAYNRDVMATAASGLPPIMDPPVPPPTKDEVTEQLREGLRGEGALGAGQVLQELGFGPELEERESRVARQVANEAQVLRLDGRGYKTATEALKEQFPYYIGGEYYKPWRDGAPNRDTGYVRPKHNRPAAAMVGAFDPHATESGAPHPAKFWADSVRYQERKPVRVAQYSSSESGGGATGTPGATSGRDDKKARREAAKELLRHLRDQHAFKTGAKINGYDVAGKDPHELAEQEAFPNPLKPIYRGDMDEMLSDLDDEKKAPAVETQLNEAVRYLKNKGDLLDLDNDIRDKFTQAGKSGGTEGWRHYIEYPTLDRPEEFKGRAFKPDADADAVKEGYTQLREVKVLVADPEMKFPAKLADLKSEHLTKAAAVLKQAARELDRARENGRVGQAKEDEKQLKVRATGLAMANQLRRNLKSAEERDKEEDKQRRKNIHFVQMEMGNQP